MTTSVPPDSVSKFAASCITEINLPQGASVLDAPCGFGRHAHWLAGAGCRVVAVDLNEKRVHTAARQRVHAAYPISWLVADLEHCLPIHAGIFDLMIVVHYYTEKIFGIAERALRPGGHLVIETFGAQGQNWQALPVLGAVPAMLDPGFRTLNISERTVGPRMDRAVVRAHAVRQG